MQRRNNVKYTILIYKHENGLWCGHKEFENGEISPCYFFNMSPLVVKMKLIEDGEDERDIFYEKDNKMKVL